MQNTSLHPLTGLGLVSACLLVTGAASAQEAASAFGPPTTSGFVTTVKPYLVSVTPEYAV